MKLTQKEIGAILYVYYINNYCEDDFSYDNGETLAKVNSYYNKLTEKYGEDTIEEIEDNIKISENEGTDYDWLKFTYKDHPELFLQVTAMFDYDGNPADGYDGDYNWIDVGMFFVNYKDVDFDDLSEKE